jgi:hypothetical protein
VNPSTGTMEFSLRDPDGYYVTISALNWPKTPRARSFVIHPSLLLRDVNPELFDSFSGCSVIWRGLKGRWNADPLRHRERLRFELAAHQVHPAEEDDADDQEVGQNWHSHRCLQIKLSLEIWLGAA